jgi:hypothetical protein
MATVQTVQKARTAQGECGKCGAKIEAGTAYRWFAPFRRPKQVRCMSAACAFKRSETCNSKLSEVYAAHEDAESSVDGWDGKDLAELVGAVQDAGERICDVAGEYLSHSEEHPNLGAASEEMASTLEDIGQDLQAFEPEDFEAEAAAEGETDDEREERVQGEREQWAENVQAEARDVLSRVEEV